MAKLSGFLVQLPGSLAPWRDGEATWPLGMLAKLSGFLAQLPGPLA